ncbi:response regulator [Marinobacteraceae bacterium S3BR75-40.1]
MTLTDHHWLIIDDDAAFRRLLARALERRGQRVDAAADANEALAAVRDQPYSRIVLDLNLDGDSGLALLPRLLELRPSVAVVVLTGYGSIATAVEAMRRGAINYLCKPVQADPLIAAFQPPNEVPDLRPSPPSVEELEFEHIQQVLQAHDGNISATARALNMHRRTLQRKLQKHSRWR